MQNGADGRGDGGDKQSADDAGRHQIRLLTAVATDGTGDDGRENQPGQPQEGESKGITS